MRIPLLLLPALLLAAFPVASRGSHLADVISKMASTEQEKEKIAPLVKFAIEHPDTPEGTGKLTALCLLKDTDFKTWRSSLPSPISTQDILTALDAMELLAKIVPATKFAIQSDVELKRQALHLPEARGKAMKVYGIHLQPGIDVQAIPNIGQLMHTQTGDNCPVCRQRADAERLQDSL